MGRSPCCAKEGLNRGAWTAHEDKILTDYIKAHGEGRWRNLPKRAGLKRCGKSCRLRWLNYLRPDIKRGNISADEEELIIRLHKLLGNRWSLIAGRLPGRTDNEIKNYWNTNLGKKAVQLDRKSSAAAAAGKYNVHSNKLRTGMGILGSRRMAMAKKTSSDEQLPAAAAAAGALTATHVVRTKAIRCSKVVINPPRPTKAAVGNSSIDSNVTNHADKARPRPRPPLINDNGDDLHHFPMKYQAQASVSTPIVNEEEEMKVNVHGDYNSSSDFMLDFNIGDEEFCLSDLLNSDFADLTDLNYYGNDHCPSLSNASTTATADDDLSPSSDQLLVFPEDILLQDQDYWTTSALQQSHVPSVY